MSHGEIKLNKNKTNNIKNFKDFLYNIFNKK